MGNIGKGFSLLLVVILAVSSLIVVESASAQSIPKSSVPEFTLKYVYRFGNTIDVSIENQHFASTTLPDGHITELRYVVHAENQFSPSPIKGNTKFPLQDSTSVSTQTIVTMTSERLVVDFPYPNGWFLIIDGKMDFKVKAEIGYRDFINNSTSYYFKVLEESDWSPTQTISIPDGAVSTSTPNPTSPTPPTSQNSTPTPAVPELPFIIVVIIILALTLAISVFKRKAR